MNARPYILGCLCLVGAAGTAAASDIDPTTGVLSVGSSGVSSFEGSARIPQGGREGAGDIMTSHSANGSHRGSGRVPIPSPADAADSTHDDMMPVRSSTPSWQSMLPGSML